MIEIRRDNDSALAAIELIQNVLDAVLFTDAMKLHAVNLNCGKTCAGSNGPWPGRRRGGHRTLGSGRGVPGKMLGAERHKVQFASLVGASLHLSARTNRGSVNIILFPARLPIGENTQTHGEILNQVS